MTKPIPLTTITFDLPIIPHALRKLRGAVIEDVMKHKAIFDAAGVPTYVFHNHKEQVPAVAGTDDLGEEPVMEAESRYMDYPLVQYKIRQRKAEIIGIGVGAQALQLWLSLAGESLTAGGQVVALSIRRHSHEQWTPRLGAQENTYRLNKWLPFNPKNFDLWRNTPRLADKAELLDKLLFGHVMHMKEGLGFEIDRKALELYVSTIDMMTFKDCFGIKKQALDVTFRTNLNLPEEIGLGQGVSIGFGKVQGISKK